MLNYKKTIAVVLLIYFFGKANGQIAYPGVNPGKAKITLSNSLLIVENNSICAKWRIKSKHITMQSFQDKCTHQKISPTNGILFSFTLNNAKTYTSDGFTLTGAPHLLSVTGNKRAIKYADRLNGKKISLLLTDNAGIDIRWDIILTNDANYIRQVFRLISKDTLAISNVSLIDVPKYTDLHRADMVDGSPLVCGNMFFALEHPMSQISDTINAMKCFLPRQDPLIPGTQLILSSVWGTTPAKQLRRGYLYYTERERATPYHQLLHYNSWYDLSWTDRKLDEKNCLDRIQTYADSLISKRKITMSAFLFDDGWDNNQTLWQFNKGFPNGFTELAKRANKYGAHLGVWISPWGGYLEDQKQRLRYGRSQQPPFETNKNGFSLAGPVYYQRFKQVTTQFATKYDVAAFKFDGVGAGNGASGASLTYQKDIEALLHLITDLRLAKPQLYFSLTVGTWPSTYWLNYGDVIWRAGRDTHFAGTGSKRQQWITYRDGEAYKNIVKRAPLYPLNALMYHGICIADNGPPEQFEMNDRDIADEIWSFFATGTSLQEMYIDPHKLSSKQWDTLADAIKWSKNNADILPDTHWLGGDPERGEIYGYASWSAAKAVFSLRNPTNETKVFKVNTITIFDLPVNANKNYKFTEVYTSTEAGKVFNTAGETEITLKPYEVKVISARSK